MEDSRRQRRIPLSTEAKVTKLISGEAIKATLVNISSYGACVKVKDPLRPNDKIKLSITLNREDQVVHSEDVLATVRYVKGVLKDYSVGIMFNIKITDKGFPIFTRCLESLKT